ncbi:hypothetical protein BO94DRAFT_622159 [Aspergillus sclerotioniger CBS 115572]|uniref:Uncharacterized protein n=1 Tax=Aspergillus sclerotioniger CBS 115572 TaxID=1450535 RepID=A0A317X8B5_9EURO|nr:hypothetical protein BO94DRAFT_622159 [Aspergillus sclerotioniger CBS 115572]PWY93817.1 hypothetical protein BO94DRAFT_622159 [Aspergillus sclerotioniger CBS 115572]
MLPPSESVLHQVHKIAEPQNGPENPEAATPPPPYSPPVHGLPKQIDGESSLQWATPRPIAIHIDASISVLGNANSIILPSIPATSPPSSPSSTPILQSAQRNRQSKLTDMATSIIAALHRTGLLNLTNESLQSVMVNINTGIKVQGARNVICLGSGFVGRKIPTEQGHEREEEYVGHVGRKRRARSEPLESCTGKKARRSS